MSYLELGAIGELIAALATVITLIYLSKQIRTNNKLAISDLENKLNSRVYDRRFAVARDKEFAEFLAKDWSSEELTKAEKTQITQYVTMLIIDAREVFLQDKLGFVSDGLLKARINVLKMGIMTNPTAKSVWATYKQLVEPEFANYFEKEIYPDGIDDDAIKVNPLYKSEEK
tara:strand:+ start:4749 stop:5264 length:516 start_codon:yes stop_codon:yes gene_type:complete